MKGYTIQHSIDLLEKAVETGGGSGGGGTAADVSYSNTSSGLVATNVQSAIDEIDTKVDSLNTDVTQLKEGDIYSTDEQVAGKWIDGSNIYKKTFVVESATFSGGSIPITTGLTGIDTIIRSECSMTQDNNGRRLVLPLGRTTLAECIMMLSYVDNGALTSSLISGIGGSSPYTGTFSNIVATYYYTKAATNNRSKKK